MIIVKYINYTDIDVYFPEHNYTSMNMNYGSFRTGQIKSPYDKSNFNIGYLGVGKYKPCHSIDKNGIAKTTKQYATWTSMLQRCYDVKFKINLPTYIGCSVCGEWLNFQTFAEWYD